MYVRPDYDDNAIYHVYNRGAAKLPIFYGPDDYHDFQDILRFLLIRFKPVEVSQTSAREKLHLPVSYNASPESNGLFRKYLNLFAYCLMPNHFHLLLQLTNPEGQLKTESGSLRYFKPVSEFMKRLAITYSHKFNYRHNREGVLFQGRFKIKPVETDEYVIQVARYIHLNPVTAGLVSKIEQWSYSDYYAYTRPGSLQYFKLTKPAFIMKFFDQDPSEYQSFVEAGISEDEIKGMAPFAIDLSDAD